jgi:hypothetical protein
MTLIASRERAKTYRLDLKLPLQVGRTFWSQPLGRRGL